MKKIILCLSLLTIISIVQSFAPKQTKTYPAALSIEGWETVIKGLGELPLKESEQVKASIIQQIQAQLQPQPKPAQKTDSTSKKKN